MTFFHQPHLDPKDKIVRFIFFVKIKLNTEFLFQFLFISNLLLKVEVNRRQLLVDDLLQKDRSD